MSLSPLFDLKGETPPARYLAAAVPLALVPYVVALAIVAVAPPPYAQPATPLSDWLFWLTPLRWTAAHADGALPFLFALLVSLAASWLVVVLSFRRAAWANRGFFLVLLAPVPTLQPFAILALALMPRRRAPAAEREQPPRRLAAAQGMLAGAFLTVAGVAASTLAFGSYGYGVFLLLPLLVGFTTAYIANHPALLPTGGTTKVVTTASLVGALGLIALALEGVGCIVLAAPLAAALIAIGAAMGRRLAERRHERARPLALSVAVLPLVFLAEALLPPAVDLRTSQAVEIAAPPSAVWRALTRMERIDEPPPLTGRFGLAYPLGASMRGEGVGAERIGRFSTGTAAERVTAWSPERKLAFEVLDQPPMMTELSPYRHVHAPHTEGYAEIRSMAFDLEPIAGGTRLTVRTAHVVRLDPVLYWAPVGRWAVNANVDRVLRQVRTVAERASGKGGRAGDALGSTKGRVS